MALRSTGEEHICHFGCAAGKWEVRRRDAQQRLTVATVVEKPTVEYARANLVTPGLAAGEYLTAFGLYILTEARTLFDYLAKQEANRKAVGPTAGRLELTPALDKIRA